MLGRRRSVTLPDPPQETPRQSQGAKGVDGSQPERARVGSLTRDLNRSRDEISGEEDEEAEKVGWRDENSAKAMTRGRRDGVVMCGGETKKKNAVSLLLIRV
ncbi:hypothetical protein MLD38_007799 [Melastoma candidum]|uniref:Uncharacterized protein n=1 Tax=Melastoma candidum TaxID=119954 RepID=A0ACB9RW00_9MYRT|nr:hypothetical protein MLD38_007799 [Melastoma candidum]